MRGSRLWCCSPFRVRSSFAVTKRAHVMRFDAPHFSIAQIAHWKVEKNELSIEWKMVLLIACSIVAKAIQSARLPSNLKIWYCILNETVGVSRLRFQQTISFFLHFCSSSRWCFDALENFFSIHSFSSATEIYLSDNFRYIYRLCHLKWPNAKWNSLHSLSLFFASIEWRSTGDFGVERFNACAHCEPNQWQFV